jgi:hypothetical protein
MNNEPREVCSECRGYGADEWPKYPSMCGGLPCPECNGVCLACVERRARRGGER